MNKWVSRAVYVGFVALSSIAMKIGWLIPDGAGYASYLASLFLDGDLNFFNQYALSGIITPNLIHGATLTANGYIFTFWAIGAPLLWMPFWLIGHAITLVGHHFGQTWTPNGFTIYYNIGVRFGTALMGLCALMMNALWSRKYSGSRAAFLGIFLTAIGTPYYWYLFNFGDCSHVPASFAISLFLIVWEAYRTDRENKTGFLLGLLGGFVTMVKPNLVFIFLFPVAIWISEWRKQLRTLLLKQAGFVLLGSAVAFALQMWIWQILFGNPFGPILEKGVTHYYKFFAGHFWLLDVLFSSYHGLFFFAPITICTFIGLISLMKTDRVVAIPSLLMLISQILLMANERYFWEGGAFGLRRVVDCTPLFAFGIAYSLKTVFQRKWIMLPAAATIWTILLAFAYNRHPIGLLNEYQPPRLILSWIGDALRHLPDAIFAAFSIPAPPKLFLPALFVFAVVGYFIYKVILRLADTCMMDSAERTRRPLNVLMLTVLAFVLVGYALVSRATVRGEQSKIRYAKQFQWLAQRQDTIMAYEESSFLVNEGKYVALSRSWHSARESFREALQMTPNPEQTSNDIADFAKQHLPPEQVQQYMDSLKQK